MLKVRRADVLEAKEALVAARLAVITNCTAAVISAAANTASPAFPGASAVGLGVSQGGSVGKQLLLHFTCSLPVGPLP